MVGGLARSEVDDAGFVWDIGGHVGFSRFPLYNEVATRALKGDWACHRRCARIYLAGRFVPYPYQLNVHRVSRRRACRAAAEMLLARRGPPPPGESFARWARRYFGSAVSGDFLLPYNEKVWGYPAESLGTQWIADRVALPRPSTLLYSALFGRGKADWGPNRSFRFPRRGGTGALWQALARSLPPGVLTLSAPVEAIDPTSRTVETADECIGFDTLISSIPLPELLQRLSGIPAATREAGGALRHSAVHVVGFGFQGPRPAILDGLSWVYFPEPEIPFHRVTVLSNYSPHNVPPLLGAWSLLVEASETPWQPVATENLAGRTLAALEKANLVPRGAEPVSVWQHREAYGYPTPTVDRDTILARLLPALEARGIYSRGRFGAWRYEVSNQDHCFMQGVEIVDRLVRGRAENVVTLSGTTPPRAAARAAG